MRLLVAHGSPAARTAIMRAIDRHHPDGEHDAEDLIESGDGQDVLDLLLSDDAPRLAVVDWDLPGLDGPELCRLLRDFRIGGPPYIVMLASGRHADVSVVLEAGANDCIRTPAPAAEIRERVQAGIDFVRVPWETRERAATLDAVLTPETDAGGSAYFDAPGCPAAPVRATVDLQAVLTQL